MDPKFEGARPVRTTQWQVEWVEDMPERMGAGKLYISVKHRLVEHLCACGCGTEVSLPLGRSEWRLMYDGDSISIWPSVGNWRLPCKSHYIIEENRTRWCRHWSEEEILAGRMRGRTEKLKDVEKKQKKRKWWRRILETLCVKAKTLSDIAALYRDGNYLTV